MKDYIIKGTGVAQSTDYGLDDRGSISGRGKRFFL
jgi:hypothetical protein